MTATMTNISMRYASTQQHDIHRCEQGLAPILCASCACGGALYGAKRGDGPAQAIWLQTGSGVPLIALHPVVRLGED